MKDDNDSAEPAASSIAALNLLRLAQFRDDKRLDGARDKNNRRIRADAFAFSQRHAANVGRARLLVKQAATDRDRREERTAQKPKHCSEKCIVIFCRRQVLILADGGEGQKYLGEKNEAIRAMSMVDGKPAAYVCENFTCKAPVTDPKALSKLLSAP